MAAAAELHRPEVYVDESIHDEHGFIVTALVFARRDLGPPVAEALTEAGLVPGRDEFKSCAPMALDESMRTLRSRLLDIAMSDTRIAIVVSASDRRGALGADVLAGLDQVLRRNGVPTPIAGAFDAGLFRSGAQGRALADGIPYLAGSDLAFEQDSRTTLGLQVADAVAHAMGQILRQQVMIAPKRVDIGGEETGYAPGTIAPLWWELLMGMRYALFVRPVVVEGQEKSVPPAMEPLVVPADEDDIVHRQHPHLLGWGVILAQGVAPEVARAATEAFERLWLGCIH